MINTNQKTVVLNHLEDFVIAITFNPWENLKSARKKTYSNRKPVLKFIQIKYQWDSLFIRGMISIAYSTKIAN